jgi:hypothetical protein
MISTDNVIALNRPEPEPVGFAQARDAWLSRWHSDRRLTHSERVICSRMHQYFNREHFERTAGDLLAWPSWQTLMDETGLSKTSVYERVRNLERLRAFEVEHGRYDDKTKKRAGNRYFVKKSKVHSAEPCRGDQGSPSRTNQGSPSRTRLSESHSVNIKKEEDSKIGLPRGPKAAPEKESKPSSTDSPLPSLQPACDVPRPTTVLPPEIQKWLGGLSRMPSPRHWDHRQKDTATIERYRLAALSKANGGAGATVVSS